MFGLTGMVIGSVADFVANALTADTAGLAGVGVKTTAKVLGRVLPAAVIALKKAVK